MTPYLQFRRNFEQWLRVHVSRTMQLPEPTIAKTNDWWVVSNLAFVRIGLVCGFVRWSVGHLKNWITARSWPLVVKKFNCRFSENGTIIENAIMRYRWAKAKIGNGYVALMECFDIFAREEVGSYESGNQIEVGSYDTVIRMLSLLCLCFPPSLLPWCAVVINFFVSWSIEKYSHCTILPLVLWWLGKIIATALEVQSFKMWSHVKQATESTINQSNQIHNQPSWHWTFLPCCKWDKIKKCWRRLRANFQ